MTVRLPFQFAQGLLARQGKVDGLELIAALRKLIDDNDVSLEKVQALMDRDDLPDKVQGLQEEVFGWHPL